ncbi:MAG: hypothetical protein FNT15_05555 [Sulfurovum sp.]|nr:MAG: hypothetical protein FNT15_05555 [Sulfurovum sp.]
MIINEQQPALNNTQFETGTFSVEESPLLFWVMSNALYQFKERAVLRELTANGWDAHVSAGCTNTPIRIKLPTNLEPELIIQDSGIGMSRDDLENYYFAYLKSTKRDTNDQIGGFGIGCKTPFILSDTYTVTTVKDGIKNIAIALLDGGIPKPIYVSQEVVDEPNGTTITIPVSKEESMNRLREEARKLFIRWPVRPVITFGSTGTFVQNETPYKPFNDYLYLSEYSFYWNTVDTQKSLGMVTLGMFEYIIPEALKERMEQRYALELKSLLSSIQCLSSNTKLVLNFILPIGSLDLSPSRESIEDTSRNTEVIYTYVKKAVEDLLKDVKDNLLPMTIRIKELFGILPETYPMFLKLQETFFQEFSPDLLNTVSSYLTNTKVEFLTEDVVKALQELVAIKSLYLRFHDRKFLHSFLDKKTYLQKALHTVLNEYGTYRIGRTRNSANWITRPASINLDIVMDLDKVPVFYGTGSIIVKWAKVNNTEFVKQNDDIIDLKHIQCISNKEVYDTYLKVIGSKALVLSEDLFFVPKSIRKNTQSGQSKIKKDETLVFKVLFDNTGITKMGSIVSVSDWYDKTYPQNTQFSVLKYSTDGYHSTWDTALLGHPIKTPVVILREQRQGEISTKRYEKFFAKYASVQVLSHSSYPYEMHEVYREMYKPYLPYLEKFLVALELLCIRVEGLPEMSSWSFMKTYRYLAQKTSLKYIRTLMTSSEIKIIARLAIGYYPFYGIREILDKMYNNSVYSSGFLSGLNLAALAHWAGTNQKQVGILVQDSSGPSLLRRTFNNHQKEWLMKHPLMHQELVQIYQSTINSEN